MASAISRVWISSSENKKRKLLKQRESFFQRNGGISLRQKLSNRRFSSKQMRIYNAEQMKTATCTYEDSQVIGRIGQSTFYRGNLPGTGEVVIQKILEIPQSHIPHFVEKMIFLSQPRLHPNIVRIIGCCLETQSPIIVYELTEAGFRNTLSKNIHDSDMCIRAATNAAGGLTNMHSGTSGGTTFLHGNISCDFVVFDNSNYPKLFYTVESSSSTQREENNMYIDPQFSSSGKLTKQNDVYSFGIVLVHLLNKEHNMQARDFESSLRELKNNERVASKVRGVADLAERCLMLNERPNMEEVQKELERLSNSI